MKKPALVSALFLVVGIHAWAANIAVIDSGVDYKHTDLSAKMWSNPNSPVETKTADGTVYKDDERGWNFAEKNNQVIDYKYLGTFSADCYKVFEVQGKILKGTATDDEKNWYKTKKADQTFLKELGKFGNFVHGTHVSGISSINAPKSKLIAMKIIPTEQPGAGLQAWLADKKNEDKRPADNVLAKLFLGMIAQNQAKMLITIGKYTAAVKSDVANGSFGVSVKAASGVVAGLLKNILGKEPTAEETEEYTKYFINQIITASKGFVDAAPNTLFVFAAGNDGTDNDTLPASPANIKTDNAISVAATLGITSLATFSNYGKTLVDVAAPGVVIKSTIPGDKYLELSGTSMAAPYVTNVAALVKDGNPALKPVEIKRVLMETVDVKSFLSGKVKSGGIVNVKRAAKAAELSASQSLDAAIAQAKKEVADMRDDGAGRLAPMKDLMPIPLPTLF